MFICLFSGKFGMQLAWIKSYNFSFNISCKDTSFWTKWRPSWIFVHKLCKFSHNWIFFWKLYWMYGEKLIIFIELIYPSFKWDEAWNTAVNTCRDINKNVKVVNFPLIFGWRQFKLIWSYNFDAYCKNHSKCLLQPYDLVTLAPRPDAAGNKENLKTAL